MLSSSRGQGNFRGLEALRPWTSKSRTSPLFTQLCIVFAHFFAEYTITQNSPVFNLNRWYIREFWLFFWVYKSTFVFCLSSFANLQVRMVHLHFSGQNNTMLSLVMLLWVDFFTEFDIYFADCMRAFAIS